MCFLFPAFEDRLYVPGMFVFELTVTEVGQLLWLSTMFIKSLVFKIRD